MSLTGSHRFLEIFNRPFLARETAALLVVKPSQLLQDFGVVRVAFQDSVIGEFGTIVLRQK
jgi:hypothetical protein